MLTFFGSGQFSEIQSRPGMRFALLVGAGSILVTASATLLAFLGLPPFEDQEKAAFILLYTLVIEMLAMLSIIAYHFVKLLRNRTVARLQQRMVWSIIPLIATPSVLVAVFSVLFLNLGLENWMSTEVKTALEESQDIAESYLQEHHQSLSRDVLGVAQSFDQIFQFRAIAETDVTHFLRIQIQTRNIDQAMILEITPSGRTQVLARAGFTAVLETEPVRQKDIERASRGELVLIIGQNTDQARGLIKFRIGNNLYLYAGRYISPKVVQQTAIVKGAVRNFTRLEQQIDGLKFGFVLMFALFSLLCILISVYLSLVFARSLTEPLGRLTEVARRIGQGDLSARMVTAIGDTPQDETVILSEAFNTMANGLQRSQSDLIAANADIAHQRDYTENILRSVSTGIISLDENAAPLSINQRAQEILDCSAEPTEIDLLGLLPEIAPVVHDPGIIPPSGVWQKPTQVLLPGGENRALLIRIVKLHGEENGQLLLSIDDISELEQAQRLAAWSEVAKRLAHEIRNPLTPIRLATERLRRKYPPLLASLAAESKSVHPRDGEDLAQSTLTILRQVDNIAVMVKEFSSFAQMPKATFARENLVDICRESVFIEQNRDHRVTVCAELPEEAVWWDCDRRQIIQICVNLLKNAAEAISEKGSHESEGRVTLALETQSGQVCLRVYDNGPGWPEQEREKLFDPYHSIRKGGSGLGLGLAIVQRIVREHHGSCSLEDAPNGGAEVRLLFRRDENLKGEL